MTEVTWIVRRAMAENSGIDAEVFRGQAQVIANSLNITRGEPLVTPEAEGEDARKAGGLAELVFDPFDQFTQSQAVPG